MVYPYSFITESESWKNCYSAAFHKQTKKYPPKNVPKLYIKKKHEHFGKKKHKFVWSGLFLSLEMDRIMTIKRLLVQRKKEIYGIKSYISIKKIKKIA